ncbi:MAG TPA: tRNA (N6-threonylcarbamoyladenosine(37)-N6)-methyltransferase TrmO [Burkholderiales bacterium]|nr:tRNA (N6-threonylcarbamoyladenosine(37)-N6)-methyltransferase TrmO [Burkholderiales bacterium]
MSEARSGRRRPGVRIFHVRPIGFVRSPFKNPEDLPPPALAPPRFFDRVRGEIVVFDDLAPGLESLDGFSHLIVIFAFHRASGFKLRTVPPGQSRPRGVFATRSPHRPNPLGLSVVRLIARDGPVLKVSGLDMIDGTPVLDIKPYTRRDRKSRATSGWQGQRGPSAR